MEYLREQETINIDEKYVRMLRYADNQGSVIDMREEYTYGFTTADDANAKPLIDDCKAFIDQTKSILYG